MPTIDIFFEVFNAAKLELEQTGCFILNNTALTLNQLRDLQDYIQNTETPFYQFCLSDVELIYSSYSISSKIQRSIISGALADEERPQWGRRYDLKHQTLLYPEAALSLEEHKKALEDALTTLLTLPFWHRIQLEKVQFSDGKRLSDKFSENLLKNLRGHPDESQASNLEVLILKDIAIDAIDLSHLIKISPSLMSLQLRPNGVDDFFLRDLLPSLYLHPSLETLELLEHPLSASDYSALHQLLDNNYHIERLELARPSADAVAFEDYKNLLSRFVQDNEQRFYYEQLNQAKLLEMTENAMVDKDIPALDILLKQPNSLLSIRSGEEKTLPEVYEALPPIYGGHPSHMENLWRQTYLNLNAPFSEDKTAGEHLLEKAFAENDLESIKLLLNPGSNLPISKSLNHFLLNKLFTADNTSPWKGLILSYLNQDLSTFSPWINQLLAHHVNIQSGLNDLKQHLDAYLAILVDRITWSPFKKKILQVYNLLDDRKKEWELDFQNLLEGTQKAGEEEVLYKSFRVLDTHIEEIVRQATEAKRGLLNRSSLHGEASRLSKRLLQQMREYCDEIVENQNKVITELNHSQAELKEANVDLQKKLDKTNQERQQEKQEMDEKLKEMETRSKEQEKKLRTEMETKAKIHEEKIDQLYQLIGQRLPSSMPEQSTTASANEKSSMSTPRLFKP